MTDLGSPNLQNKNPKIDIRRRSYGHRLRVCVYHDPLSKERAKEGAIGRQS